MPRQIFKNLNIAAVAPLPEKFTEQDLKRWTELRRGRYSQQMHEGVTHLLCTHEQFRDKNQKVKDALARGGRIHIVHFDWYEFSAAHDKKEPEAKYCLRRQQSAENAKIREAARIERGKRESERFINTNLFHIYIDREGFTYEISITRDAMHTGEPGQRYVLYLWESNAKPHLYWFAAKFIKKKGHGQPTYHRPTAHSTKWQEQMDLFADFFAKKTGLSWEERVIGYHTKDESFFQYAPPIRGKPVGRRLRFSAEYCWEINAKIRGLPWPPPAIAEHSVSESPATSTSSSGASSSCSLHGVGGAEDQRVLEQSRLETASVDGEACEASTTESATSVEAGIDEITDPESLEMNGVTPSTLSSGGDDHAPAAEGGMLAMTRSVPICAQ